MGCLAGLESTLRGNETPTRENLHRARSFHHARTMVSHMQERSPCARAVADALQRRQRPLLRDDRRNATSRNRHRRRRSHADLAIVHFPGEERFGPASRRKTFLRARRSPRLRGCRHGWAYGAVKATGSSSRQAWLKQPHWICPLLQTTRDRSRGQAAPDRA